MYRDDRVAPVGAATKGSSGSHSDRGLQDVKTVAETRTVDWLLSHLKVMRYWQEQLIADNAQGDMIDIVHRQEAWLGMMLDKIRRS